jgi:glycosyltransferase involved in cell wall biosynthesis
MVGWEARERLAFIGGFIKPRDSFAQGTLHAAFRACQAIAEVGGYGALDVYHDPQRGGRNGDLVLPRQPPTRLLDKALLPTSHERYRAIVINNGEQLTSVPFVLRPHDDWAPLIFSVGTAHAAHQWQNLLLGLLSGAGRLTDGIIFKSSRARELFRRVWTEWSERFALIPFPEASSVVIPNGVDVDQYRRSDPQRAKTRELMRLRPEDVVFLAFSRLSPGSKGDQQALLVRWKEVVAKFPEALLVMAGAQVDRSYVVEQRYLARAAGVADRVLILENPFETMSDARGSLMSAADVFVHLTTGIEETSSLVVHEAMAHALPVIVSDWAGLGEVVVDGVDGYIIPTGAMPTPFDLSAQLFGTADLTVALAASKSATCNFDDFITCAALFADRERCRRMSLAARKSAEGRSLHAIARAYVAHIDHVSQQAVAAWTGRSTFQPLVDMSAVVQAQSSFVFNANQRVRLADVANVDFVTQGWGAENQTEIDAALAALRHTEELELGTLAQAVVASRAGAAARPAPATALASASRLIVRLMNLGAIRIEPGD